MKNKFLPFYMVSLLSVSLSANEIINVTKGWDLKGANSDINVTATFNDDRIKTVWSYDAATQMWNAYSPALDTTALIESTQGVNTLNLIKKLDGYWVNSSENFTLTKLEPVVENPTNEDNTTTDPIVIDMESPFVDPLIDVTVADVANKSFKLYNDEGYETITFDALGVSGAIVEQNCNLTTDTYQAKVEDGSLNIYKNGVIEESFKILASDKNGVVLGGKYIGKVDTTDSYSYNSGPTMLYLLNSNVSESPVNMATVLPYTAYPEYSYYDNWSQTFNVDYTITNRYYDSYNGEYVENINGNFSIVNNAIKQADQYISDYYSDSWSNTLQKVSSIGRYDIANMSYEGSYTSKNDLIDSTTTWDTIINMAADTRPIFNGMYFTTSGTFSTDWDQSGTYVISKNTITVTYNESDGYCWSDTYTLDTTAQTITNSYSDSYKNIVSSTAIYKIGVMDSNYNARILNKNLSALEQFEARKKEIMSRR